MSIFRKSYRVPCNLEEKVKVALTRLQTQNILQPVSYSDWAHCDCFKKSGERICADYKVTVNKSLDKMLYPLPVKEDVLNKLQGAYTCIILDLH